MCAAIRATLYLLVLSHLPPALVVVSVQDVQAGLIWRYQYFFLVCNFYNSR